MRKNGLIPYNGISSHKQTTREKARQEKLEKQEKLSPAADVIKEEFDKARNEVNELLLNIVNPETSDDNVKASLLAVRMTRDKLNTLESRINKILRHNEKPERADTDEQ